MSGEVLNEEETNNIKSILIISKYILSMNDGHSLIIKFKNGRLCSKSDLKNKFDEDLKYFIGNKIDTYVAMNLISFAFLSIKAGSLYVMVTKEEDGLVFTIKEADKRAVAGKHKI